MARLTVSVLGEFEVWIDGGKAQEFESDKVRALLAYLIVGADHAHRRETLIGLLWPDCPEEAARHSLRQALFNLRLGLGDHIAKPPYLLISRDSIQFNRESDHLLDLDQFKATYQAWKTSGAKGSSLPTDLMLQLEQMVKLYRGEFLQHFSLSSSSEFENWIIVQRESLRQETMEVLACLAAEYERLGDLQGARTCTSRQLELDPWREEAHYAMMRLLALDGQRSAALARYEACKKVLADELGVEPSEKTRALYEQIRSGALGNSDDARHTMRTARIPVPTTPFIGRLKELADLGQMIENPQCRFITLMGPGGIGKTRLALQAAHEHGGKFSQGAAFVPLASAASMDAVIPALANGVGYVFYGPTEPKEQVLHYLQDKEILLVLDNLEHLLEERSHGVAIGDFLAQLLQEAPHVKLLTTSREPISLQGEWLYGVE
ncbi:MAG TPA: BTAD domain-containing putative transcriptional regulator, partial [Anaerolineales bacterium]